jgi:hypothetical protein
MIVFDFVNANCACVTFIADTPMSVNKKVLQKVEVFILIGLGL